MTEQEALDLADKKPQEANKMIAEAMGKCWHEFSITAGVGVFGDCRCVKCGIHLGVEHHNKNIDYLTSAEGAVAMMEWWLFNRIDLEIRKQQYTDGKVYFVSDHFKNFSKANTLNLALCLAVMKAAGKVE